MEGIALGQTLPTIHGAAAAAAAAEAAASAASHSHSSSSSIAFVMHKGWIEIDGSTRSTFANARFYLCVYVRTTVIPCIYSSHLYMELCAIKAQTCTLWATGTGGARHKSAQANVHKCCTRTSHHAGCTCDANGAIRQSDGLCAQTFHIPYEHDEHYVFIQ